MPNAYFEHVAESLAGQQLAIPDDVPEIVVGRSSECQVVLPSNSVSRRHALLRWQNGQLWVEDLDSANGTFVNGSRLTAPAPLTNQDRVAFGPLELRFVQAPAESTATVALGGSEGAATIALAPATSAAGPEVARSPAAPAEEPPRPVLPPRKPPVREAKKPAAELTPVDPAPDPRARAEAAAVPAAGSALQLAAIAAASFLVVYGVGLLIVYLF